MYCPKCGSENEENAQACLTCGEVFQTAGVDASVSQKIPNYLAQSILVTLLCCLPLGIPAIIFAAQVNGKLAAGDVEGALNSSRIAKMWCWISFGLGLVVIVLQVLLQIAVITLPALSQ